MNGADGQGRPRPGLASLVAMAGLIACPDEEFDAAVRAAQITAGLPPIGAFALEPHARGRELFELCLAHARFGGWFEALLVEIIRCRLDGGRLIHQLAQSIVIPVLPRHGATEGATDPDADDTVELQAKARPLIEPGEPILAGMGVFAAMGYTAQVMVYGQKPKLGTGFLVGPDLLLTAWHVIESLLEPIPPATVDPHRPWLTYRPRNGSSADIEIVFDNVRFQTPKGEISLNRRKIRREKVADDWLECGTPMPQPHNKLPPPGGFHNDWDYALLRLARSVSRENGYLAFEPTELPRAAGARLWIFQYQGQHPLIYDTHQFSGTYGYGRERFYYQVNTEGGASGGPCLDSEFRLVGMHLAGWEAKLPDLDKANLGVPIVKVYDHLMNALGGRLPPPLPQGSAARCLRKQPDYPIVGRWDFQELVWTDLVLSDRARILTVSGEDCGFFAKILDSMLPPSNHLVVSLSVQRIAKEPTQVVHDTLMETLGPAGPADPTVASAEQGPPASVGALRSTVGALSLDHLVPEFIRHADRVRAGKTAWIVLDELDKVAVDREASDYLYLLYHQVVEHPWLRIVLLGFRGDRAAFRGAPSLDYRKAPLSKDDVLDYLRYLVHAKNAGLSPKDVEIRAAQVFGEAGDPNGAGHMEAIAEALRKLGAWLQGN